jgi:hypothetical protein
MKLALDAFSLGVFRMIAFAQLAHLMPQGGYRMKLIKIRNY